MNHGGKRKGAGRKPAGTIRFWAWVKPATAKAIIATAKDKGQTRGQWLDSMFPSSPTIPK